jgi:hypothetical protein
MDDGPQIGNMTYAWCAYGISVTLIPYAHT